MFFLWYNFLVIIVLIFFKVGNRIDDFDERGGLPSWIQPWLILAAQVQKWVSERASSTILPEDQTRIPYISHINWIPSLLEHLSYKKNDNWVYEDFKWLHVLDIGAGFWWLAKTLQSSAASITLVDPLFENSDLKEDLDNEIKFHETLIYTRGEYLEKSPDADFIHNQKDDVNQVLIDLYWWKNQYNSKVHTNIKRFWNFSESMTWVETCSQDVVFMNHFLDKIEVRRNRTYEEIIRVLKPGWVIYISDDELSDKIMTELEYYFNIEDLSVPWKVVLKCTLKN